MDEDLQSMSKDQLIEEIRKLRMGIREHRTAQVIIYVGIIRNFGRYFLKK
jgi:hypothetical protein